MKNRGKNPFVDRGYHLLGAGLVVALTLTAGVKSIRANASQLEKGLSESREPVPIESVVSSPERDTPEPIEPKPTYDSVLVERAQKFIDCYSAGPAPMTAEQIITSSRKTGTSLKMYMINNAREGHFGTLGRAVPTRNSCNVRNMDDGTNEYKNSWEAGLDRFGYLIANEYFPGETPSFEKFIARDFRRPDGKRYMRDKDAKEISLSIEKTYDEVMGDRG